MEINKKWSKDDDVSW